MRAEPAPHQPHLLSSTDTMLLLRMDEASGDLVDAAGGADFTLVGTAPAAPRVFGGADLGVGARDFDGFSGGAHRASSADHRAILCSSAGQACTLETWFNADAIPGGGATIFAHGDAGGGQRTLLRVSLVTGGEIEVAWQDAGGSWTTLTTSGAGVLTGRAYHLGVVLRWPTASNAAAGEARDVEVWLGTSGESFTDLAHSKVGEWFDQPNPDAASGATGRWSVGYDYGAAAPAYFDGRLDDVRLSSFAAYDACLRDSWGRGLRAFDVSKICTQPGEGEREGGDYEVHKRLEVASYDGSWVDLCDLSGHDFLIAAEWENNGDLAMMPATFELHRQHYDVTLIPDETDGLLVYERYRRLLEDGKRIRLWTSTVPRDTGRANAEPFFDLQFDGIIDDGGVEFGKRRLTVKALDLGQALARQWVEPSPDPDEADQERQYGDALGAAAEGELQQIINDNDPAVFPILSIDDVGGVLEVQVYDATARTGRPNSVDVDEAGFRIDGTVSFDGVHTVDPSGTNSAQVTSYEAAPAAAAETTGTLTYERRYSYIGGRPFIYAPTSSGWMLYPFNVPFTKNVLQAVQGLPEEIGWDCRYVWDDHRHEFRLTFFDPRTLSDTLRGTIRMSYGVHEVQSARVSKEDVRNVVVVEYADHNDLDDSSAPIRKTEVYVDAVSAEKHGRRYCRVATGASSHVTTAAEAYDLAFAIGRDLGAPFTEWSLEIPYRGAIEVGNKWNFVREPGEQIEIAGDTNNYRAVSGVRHRLDGKRLRTTLACRNVVAVGKTKKWRDSLARAGRNPSKGKRPPPAPTGLTVIGTAKAIIVEVDEFTGHTMRRWDRMEVFWSTTNGFGLAGNFKGSVRGTRMHVGALVGGTDYYFRVRVRDSMGNVSEATSQVTTKPTGTSGAGGGDVVGPASSTDRAIPTFDGATGQLLRDNPNAKVLSSGAVLVKPAGAGLILFDGTNYRRITMTTRGALQIDDLGTSEPTT